MKEQIIAKRYADAFIETIRPTIGVERALHETKALRRALAESQDLRDFFASPQISRVEKIQFIDGVLKSNFSEDFRNFLKLLINKGRMEYFVDIAEYLRITYTRENVIDVVLKTTFMLEHDVIQKIQDKLQAKFKRKMNFYIELDSELCGGVQAIIGNTIIDGTIKFRLNELKRKLRAIEVF